MSRESWQPQSALKGVHATDTVRETGGITSVTLIERPVRPARLIMARKDAAVATAERAAGVLGLALPMRPMRTAGGGVEAVWSGPAQWLVMSDADDKLVALTAAVAGVASCSEQTDARVILRLAGLGARRTLMKVVGIDVHETAFPAGAAAMTPVAHIAAHLWRLPDADGAPVYEIAAPRSSIGSLWHALVAAAGGLGLDARPAQTALPK
jgi:sarcosine oxidase subunit gamma